MLGIVIIGIGVYVMCVWVVSDVKMEMQEMCKKLNNSGESGTIFSLSIAFCDSSLASWCYYSLHPRLI